MTDKKDNPEKRKNLPTRTTGDQWAQLKPRARAMRKEPTPAEDVLWQRLRRKQVGGFRFRRQAPIDRFIVDFYCAEARLVIEVDGSIHDEPEQADYDADRQVYLESKGIRVLRFSNGDVIQQTDAVIERIGEALIGEEE